MAQTQETSTQLDAGGTGDAIDRLAGVTPGSAVAELRAQRADVVKYAQGSYEVLLEPDDLGGVSREERELIALRVGVSTPSTKLVEAHRARLRALGTDRALIAAVEEFPRGGALTPRLEAILRHTDRLTKEPGVSTPDHIAELKAAGLTSRDIVTISQLIAFLSFQVRVVAALRLLGRNA